MRVPSNWQCVPVVLAAVLAGCLLDVGDDDIFVDAGVDEHDVAYADEILELNTRLRNEYVATVDTASASSYVTSERTDGSWADIDYTTQTPSSWPALTHLSRLLAIAVAYHKSGGSLYHSTAAVTAVRRGLDNWFARSPRHTNWYFNQIGGPTVMMKIVLVIESSLTSTQIAKAIDWSNEGCYTCSGGTSIGQNRVWIAGVFIHIYALLSRRDATGLRAAFAAIGGETTVHDGDGIRQDMSFHQHGNQLYNASYGAAFISDTARWMRLARGLSFGFTAAQVDGFSALVLDGTRWMIRRGSWDHAAAGRTLTRVGTMKVGLISSLDSMISLGTARRTSFETFKAHILGTNDSALVGDKQFWKSDYHVHRRAGYLASVKLCSTRVSSHEGGNGENLQGYYLDQGAMMIMRDGLEYRDIYPVWDFARVPGVTSPHKSPAPKPRDFGEPGKATFAGGVSNGTYGASGFGLTWDGITGKKAWFFFGSQIVALGVGITGTTTVPVFTSINQTLRRSAITVGYGTATGTPAATGETVLSSPRWVHHDGVGYVFPKARNVKLNNAAQTGSWRRITTNGTTTSVSLDVFSLWFDHGLSPSQASYEYVLIPGVTAEQVRTQAVTPAVRIIENSVNRQAVRNDVSRVAGAVFYAAGSITLRTGLTLAVDQKAIVLVDESSTSAIKVSVAQPEGAAATVRVTLSGGVSKVLTFSLPGGRLGGSSVTQTVAL